MTEVKGGDGFSGTSVAATEIERCGMVMYRRSTIRSTIGLLCCVGCEHFVPCAIIPSFFRCPPRYWLAKMLFFLAYRYGDWLIYCFLWRVVIVIGLCIVYSSMWFTGRASEVIGPCYLILFRSYQLNVFCRCWCVTERFFLEGRDRWLFVVCHKRRLFGQPRRCLNPFGTRYYFFTLNSVLKSWNLFQKVKWMMVTAAAAIVPLATPSPCCLWRYQFFVFYFGWGGAGYILG